MSGLQQSLGLHIAQEQTQKLFMNQEMRQAITILQYSSSELTSFVEKQLELNPVFDLDRSKVNKRRNTATTDPIALIPEKKRSLTDVLLEQLAYQSIPKQKHKITQYLIGLLDDDGYLREDLNRIAVEMRCTYIEVEEALALVHTLEPIGVGARNLVECLLLQLRAQGDVSPLMEEVLVHHLPDLAEGKYSYVAKTLAMAEADIQAIMARIEHLHPRPGAMYDVGRTNYLTPDLYVEAIDGELRFIVNEYVYPQLQIDPVYHRYLSQLRSDEPSQSYVKEHLRNALWLIKSMEQRKATVLKVAQAIFAHQPDFLQQGLVALRPLTLHDIAQEIGVHESTVSRATNQKYVQTPKGLFELKLFFSNGLETADGQMVTPHWIKERITTLIREEDKDKPLSDQQMMMRLREEGVRIARRTIMKYREELHIPASNKRRRRT